MQSFEFVSGMIQKPMLVWLENVVVWPDRLVCSWLPFLDNNVFQDNRKYELLREQGGWKAGNCTALFGLQYLASRPSLWHWPKLLTSLGFKRKTVGLCLTTANHMKQFEANEMGYKHYLVCSSNSILKVWPSNV